MRILITGGTGSLGSALARKFAGEGHELMLISRGDDKQAALRVELPKAVFHSLDLGNDASYRRLLAICERQDICIHTAAQKRVGEGQYQPMAYLDTNVLGTLYLLQAWYQTHSTCKQLLAISTDKAVSPVNFYGATKMLMTGLVRFEGFDGSVLRYGNVVTSNGSFIQAWQERRAKQLPLIVKMGQPAGESPTRFFLTMPEAITLIEHTLGLIADGKDGIYIPVNLKAFSVLDVARATGLKVVTGTIEPGEKLHEVLLAPGERVDPTASLKLGRVTMAHWPDDEYYAPYRSNTAERMTGMHVLQELKWW